MGGRLEPMGSPQAPKAECGPRWIPWAIFAMGFVLRAGHVWALRDTALVRFPTIDPAAYLARAQEILGGQLLPRDVFFQDPLYPYLLALAQLVTGGAKLGPYFVHALVGAWVGVAAYVIGRRYWGWRAGAVAGAIAAGYAPFLYLDGLLEKSAFTLAAFSSALACFPAPGAVSWRRLLASGFLIGVGALLRGNFLLLAPVLAGLAATQAHGIRLLHRAGIFIAFGAAAFAPIAPFTFHNYRVSGELILTTAQAGTAFYLGNNPQNTSGGIHHVPFNRQVPEHEADDWKREAERRSGRPLSRREVSQFWGSAAWEHIGRNPGLGWWLPLLARKAELVLHTTEVPDNATIYYAEKHSAVVRWNPLRFGVVAALGLVGAASWLLRPRRHALLWIAFGVYGTSMLLFPVSDRFRAPLALGVILGCGAAVDLLWRALRERRMTRMVLVILGSGAATWIANHSLLLQPQDTNVTARNAQLKTAHDEATAWLNAKEFEKAEAVLREAMADEWLSKKARLNLDLATALWFGNRDRAEAKRLATRSVKAFVDSGESVPDGYRLCGEIFESEGAAEQAHYWRARAEAVDSPSWLDLQQRAEAAAAAGDMPRSSGLLDELVLMDRSRPVGPVPQQAYEMLARQQLERGDRRRASETVALLRSRGGTVPSDLEALLR
ncbi:MAG: glycosyltransferase family 39 protein [Planctomycetes bacterium]|nr:glycosyltransferase family 39 protein [Planctomycetota bacterium]